MFEGYLAMGGNEILNNGRAYGYSNTAGCSLGWLRQDACDGLRQALGDGPYTADQIFEAPWYDPRNEASTRFYGAYGLQLQNVSDSTRTASITQGILDGGVVGRVRRAVREVRVRALLLARGEDALEAGLDWLKHALDPDDCGFHGNSCGQTDVCFYTACPPERGVIIDWSDWQHQAVNLVTNPSFESPDGLPAGTNQSSEWAASGMYSLEVPGADDVGYGFGEYGDGTPYGAGPFEDLQLSYVQIANLSNQTLLITARHPWQHVRFNGTNYPPDSGGRIRVQGTGIVEVSSGWWDSMLIAAGTYTAGYFDGGFAGNDTNRYSWTGAPHASTSLHETRAYTEIDETDDEYAAHVDPLLRKLHGVTTISGPLVQDKFHRRDVYAYVVEFTLAAETPWLWGETYAVEAAPTIPTVVQDIPYNLALFPRAELTNATPVVIQTNYATNPSVETTATGWIRGTTAITGADPTPYFTSDRSDDLAADGAWSLRNRILGDGSTTASGTTLLQARQDVMLTGADPLSRPSVSVWAAAVSVGGATGAAITKVEIYVEWRDAATSYGTTTLANSTNATDIAGKVWALESIAKPTVADRARVVIQHTVQWSSNTTLSSNSDIRCYIDALAVTVP